MKKLNLQDVIKNSEIKQDNVLLDYLDIQLKAIENKINEIIKYLNKKESK